MAPSTKSMRLLILTATALVLHVALGWAWAIAAPLLLGALWPDGASWRGALGMALSWGLLMAFYALSSGVYFERAAATISALIGGLPAPVAPLLSIAFAALIGLCAATLGASARRLANPPASQPA